MSDGHPEISTLVLGALQTNCYLVVCPDTHAALVIDPADDAGRIMRAAQLKGARIEQILLTHAHSDHFGALPELRESTGAKVLYHRLDAALLQMQGPRRYGLGPERLPRYLPDVQLEGGQQLPVGRLSGVVIHTPGHTPGGICLHVGNHLFSGDTLFARGMGRFDLPGGDMDTILDSLALLMGLPDETAVYPGHGPSTTIGIEKLENPYV